VQIWARAGVQPSPLDEHLAASLAPRVLSHLAHDHHSPDSPAADGLASSHVADVVAALGMICGHGLLEIQARLPTMQRGELIALVHGAMRAAAEGAGEDWAALMAAVRRDAEERLHEVRRALLQLCSSSFVSWRAELLTAPPVRLPA
jgi:hypothetical protein